MNVRVTFTKLSNKIPYQKLVVEGASSADDAISTARGTPGTSQYANGDEAFSDVLSDYDVVGGKASDAAVTAGDAGSLSGKARTISSDINTIKTLIPTALDSGFFKVALEKIASGVAINIGSSGKTLLRAEINCSSSGSNAIIAAPGSGLKIKILYLEINETTNAAQTFVLKTGSTAIDGAGKNLPANGQYKYEAPGGIVPLVLGTNEAFNIDLTNATNVSGMVVYYTE